MDPHSVGASDGVLGQSTAYVLGRLPHRVLSGLSALGLAWAKPERTVCPPQHRDAGSRTFMYQPSHAPALVGAGAGRSGAPRRGQGVTFSFLNSSTGAFEFTAIGGRNAFPELGRGGAVVFSYPIDATRSVHVAFLSKPNSQKNPKPGPSDKGAAKSGPGGAGQPQNKPSGGSSSNKPQDGAGPNPAAREKQLGDSESGPEGGSDGQRYKILVLMSDTGGGHRASAQAIKAAIGQTYGDKYDVRVVDLWGEHTPFPVNQLPKTYAFLASHPSLWSMLYNAGKDEGKMRFAEELIWKISRKKMTELFESYDPHIVVSTHPLMQTLPLRILESMRAKREAGRMSRGGLLSGETKEAGALFSKPGAGQGAAAPFIGPPPLTADRTPFVTVVTDLASGHPTWFDPRVDRCFVGSQPMYDMAIERGLQPAQLRNFGLPIRADFAEPALPKKLLRQAFGLNPDVPVVLLVGGGDGIGRVEQIARAVANQLGKYVRVPPMGAQQQPQQPAQPQQQQPAQAGSSGKEEAAAAGKDAAGKDGKDGKGGKEPEDFKSRIMTQEKGGAKPAAPRAQLPGGQLVVVCGRNAKLKKKLESQKWPVPVIVNGFVSNMSDWMAASDCVITKAGPGTICEAMSRGLPIMLSGFIPGQEEGNVPYVVDNRLGGYSEDPEKIAQMVAGWLSDEGSAELHAMSRQCLALAKPRAAFQIGDEIVSLLHASLAARGLSLAGPTRTVDLAVPDVPAAAPAAAPAASTA
eukprot:tig00001155_g7315.t1